MSGPSVRTADVAKEAGVSRATVSYVLNDRQDVRMSDATREHVWAVARRLGYIGSPAARALRNGRGDVVLLLLPDWTITSQIELLLDEIGQLVSQRGLVCLRYEGPQWQGSLDRVLGRISAACVITLDPMGDVDAQTLEATGVPEVNAWLLDRPGHPHTTRISQHDIVRAQVDHLLEQGFPRIAYLATSEPGDTSFLEARVRAFHELCAARGLTEAPSAVVSPTVANIQHQLSAWQSSTGGPLGIAAWNDFTATGILNAATALGLQVPDHLGVVGGDDTPLALLTAPSLSSVRFDLASEADGIAHRVTTALGMKDGKVPEASVPAVTVIPRASTKIR